jgi:hypothetical protein
MMKSGVVKRNDSRRKMTGGGGGVKKNDPLAVECLAYFEEK